MEEKIYELHAQMCQVFTSPKRLEILNLLRTGEKTVGELCDQAGIPQSNISQHLSILRQHGIVNTRREGTSIYYSLSNPKIIEAFDIIRQILLQRLEEEEKLAKGIRLAEKKSKSK